MAWILYVLKQHMCHLDRNISLNSHIWSAVSQLVLSRNLLYRRINPYYPINHVQPPPLTKGQQYGTLNNIWCNIMLNFSTPGLLWHDLWSISGSVLRYLNFLNPRPHTLGLTQMQPLFSVTIDEYMDQSDVSLVHLLGRHCVHISCQCDLFILWSLPHFIG